MYRILVIDDDVELCELLADYLQPEGFAISTVQEASEGINHALSGDYDLVILDVMLPETNGFEVLKRIRSKSSVAVLMLTARGEDLDRIIGLEIGADDYLPKPFNPRELIARIRAILRRSERRDADPEHYGEDNILKIGDICLDPGTMTVSQDGANIQLTHVEFLILHELLRNAGQVVSREKLAQDALDRELSLFDRSIDVHISSLRKKLGHEVNGLERFKTVRGVGYIYSKFPKPEINLK